MRPSSGLFYLSVFYMANGTRLDSESVMKTYKIIESNESNQNNFVKDPEEFTHLSTNALESSPHPNTHTHQWPLEIQTEVTQIIAAYQGVIVNGKVVLKNSGHFSLSEFENLYKLLLKSYGEVSPISFDDEINDTDKMLVSALQQDASEVLSQVQKEYFWRKKNQ